ncbi:MAG: hypothetical protein D3920_04600 [Candidatus Electrothrix sp. AW2]|nr:hypothetical protein [Candidatus Electrothrix gigas]MCI5226805.1 hypothetical protein [Candidatus Electrothrix gigas]
MPTLIKVGHQYINPEYIVSIQHTKKEFYTDGEIEVEVGNNELEKLIDRTEGFKEIEIKRMDILHIQMHGSGINSIISLYEHEAYNFLQYLEKQKDNEKGSGSDICIVNVA